ncbi:MAG TPA: peptidyl-prolyl cis-trans isomerase [Thermoanaerobaculia bacterium]|nr:peptidyl-prolyl cis-trans isomerase [Thermoanaerobaculia bacterium]
MRLRALALIVLLAGCQTRQTIPPDVIVQIGSRQLTIDDFKRYLDRNTGTELAQIVPEAASALLDQYVQEVLLSEFAAKRGIEVSAEQVAAAVRADAGSTASEKRDELRRDALLTEIAADMPPPTQEQVRAHYQQFIRDYRFDDRVRIAQILVRDEKLAADVVKRLRAGASFTELSVEHSEAPNAATGGEIGWITRSELPQVFEDEIFALGPGGTTGVLRTDTGFYIFRVNDRRPAGILEFEAAEPMVRQRLAEEAARRQLSNLLIAARQAIPVTILPRRLPFPYTGTFPASSSE